MVNDAGGLPSRTALGSPIRANLEITDACPLACEHCYTFWGFSATGHRNSRDTSGRGLAELSAVLSALIEAGLQIVTFTGGEPLARKDLLFPLISQAKEAGLRVLVNTTACMLTSADADQFASSGVDGFLVSLMSSDPAIHNAIAHANSHQRTLRGIRLLTDRGLAVTVNMVCSKSNHMTVRGTARLASELGAMMFSATPMLPTSCNAASRDLHLDADELRNVLFDLSWVRDHLPIRATTLDPVAHCQFDAEEREALGPLLGERYCCAGITDCAVSPDGDLRACIMTSEIGGNILRDGWDAAWAALSSWRSESMLPAECRSCTLVDACGGGCRVAAEATDGSLCGRDPYMTRAVHDPVPEPKRSVIAAAVTEGPTLEPQGKLMFSRDLIARREPFGGSVFVRGKAVFLREDAFALVEHYANQDYFTPQQWSTENQISLESVLAFLGVLEEDRFLTTCH